MSLMGFNSSGSAVPDTYKRCCSLGGNWAEEDLVCASFPTPVAGVAEEHQKICLAAINICCNQKHRDKQCENGVKVAKSGESCTKVVNKPGADYFKVCLCGAIELLKII